MENFLRYLEDLWWEGGAEMGSGVGRLRVGVLTGVGGRLRGKKVLSVPGGEFGERTQPVCIRHPWLRHTFSGRPVRKFLGMGGTLRTSNPPLHSPPTPVSTPTLNRPLRCPSLPQHTRRKCSCKQARCAPLVCPKWLAKELAVEHHPHEKFTFSPLCIS